MQYYFMLNSVLYLPSNHSISSVEMHLETVTTEGHHYVLENNIAENKATLNFFIQEQVQEFPN